MDISDEKIKQLAIEAISTGFLYRLMKVYPEVFSEAQLEEGAEKTDMEALTVLLPKKIVDVFKSLDGRLLPLKDTQDGHHPLVGCAISILISTAIADTLKRSIDTGELSPERISETRSLLTKLVMYMASQERKEGENE